MPNAKWLNLYYCYSTGVVVVPGVVGAQIQASIQILADAPFACYYITGTATQAALTLVAVWGGTVQINDTGVGRTFFDQAILFENIRGTAGFPYQLPMPRRVARNSTLLVTFTNNIATATNVEMVLHGYKLYKDEGPFPIER